jgi:hypothetical protein
VAVSIGQVQAIAESAPQFTKMAISVKPEQEQPRVSVSYRREVTPFLAVAAGGVMVSTLVFAWVRRSSTSLEA